MASRSADIHFERGQARDDRVFHGSAKKLSATSLHRALDSALAAYLRAASVWDVNAAFGDHRLLRFSTALTPDTEVRVEFWCEPTARVVGEVWWSPYADPWMNGERTRRLDILGFEHGDTGTLQQEFPIREADDIRRLARLVVEVLARGFDYQGETPLDVHMAWEGRAEARETYDAFSPDEVATVFTGVGFTVDEEVSEQGDPLDPPVLRCRKYGVETFVQFDERVPGEDIYRRVRFQADVPMTTAEIEHFGPPPDSIASEPRMSVSSMHAFGGGVTFEWLVERVREWDFALAEQRRLLRKDRKPRPRRPGKTETVH